MNGNDGQKRRFINDNEILDAIKDRQFIGQVPLLRPRRLIQFQVLDPYSRQLVLRVSPVSEEMRRST